MNMKKNTAPALRSYQLEALSAMKAADAHFHRTLLCLATGGGKTLTAVEHVKRWYLDAGKHVLWIAHSSELLDQAFKTLLQAGIPAEWVCRRYGKYDEVCAKSARVYLVNNLVKWQAPKANLVVIDEAHHAAAGTYRKWLEQQQRVYRHDPRVLGLTATPFRLHHGEIQSLCDFRLTKQKSLFQTVVYEKSFCELVAAGYLAPFHHIRFETKMRFTLDMGSTGDFTDRSLDTLNVAPRNRLIVEQWRRSRKEFGPTLVFVGTKEHARALAACFGEDAQCLLSDHDAEERKRILRAFASGQVPVLVNVRMITEGVDLPNIRTVVLARPTASAVLFTQMVGRGSRLSGGKSYFNLVDIHDQLGEHERYLATTAYLGGCRNPDLVASVARQGAARATFEKLGLAAFARDTAALAAIAAMPARQVVTRFRGWVTFSGTTHDDAAVATLLDEDDYAALLAAADPAGVLTPRHAQTVVGLAAGNASLAKCAAALHGGCTGRLHEFRLHVQADGHALTSAAKVLLDNGRLPTRAPDHAAIAVARQAVTVSGSAEGTVTVAGVADDAITLTQVQWAKLLEAAPEIRRRLA